MPRSLGGRFDLTSWGGVRVWLTGFLVFFALSASWALATPLTAVPDEPAHIVKAAASARLEFRGVTVEQETVVDNVLKNEEMAGFEVPASYRQLLDMHDCYHVDKRAPASCAAPITESSQNARVGTSAGANNPGYYLAVGWPSLFSTGETGIYLMRLVSAALCSALLASAVVTVVLSRRHRGLLLVGLAGAATPTALFLNGSVNPNSVEVSAGILLWTTALAVFMDPDPVLTDRRLHRAAVASAALICVRPLGPLWILGILACALLAGEKGVVRSLIGKPIVWLWTAVLSAMTVAAFAWTAHYGVITTSNVNFPQFTFANAASYTFDRTHEYLDAMVGLFGWMDVAPPIQTRWVWYLGLLAIGIAAAVFGRWRERAALGGLAIAIVAIPVLAQGKQAQHLGLIWQGRYLLAVAAGLPILITSVLAGNAERARWPRPIVPVGLFAFGLFAVDGLVMFYAALHRYAVGEWGPWFPSRPDWAPPGGLLPTVLLYLLGLGGLLGLVWSGLRAEAPGRPIAGRARTGAAEPGETAAASVAVVTGAAVATVVAPAGPSPALPTRTTASAAPRAVPAAAEMTSAPAP